MNDYPLGLSDQFGPRVKDLSVKRCFGANLDIYSAIKEDLQWIFGQNMGILVKSRHCTPCGDVINDYPLGLSDQFCPMVKGLSVKRCFVANLDIYSAIKEDLQWIFGQNMGILVKSRHCTPCGEVINDFLLALSDQF
jgi:uncharacterized protein YqcC (DUF446 family)